MVEDDGFQLGAHGLQLVGLVADRPQGGKVPAELHLLALQFADLLRVEVDRVAVGEIHRQRSQGGERRGHDEPGLARIEGDLRRDVARDEVDAGGLRQDEARGLPITSEIW